MASCPGRHPLQSAARDGNLDTMKKLLEAEPPIDINAMDLDSKFTALHEAARAGYLHIVQFLAAQMNIDINAHVQKTALCIACQSGRYEVVKFLLTLKEIDVNAGSPGLGSENYWASLDYTPLHAAANWNHVEIVKLLLDRPEIDVNAQNSFRELTPLHVAFWKPGRCYSRPFKPVKKWNNRYTGSRRDVVLALLGHKDLNANLENRSRNTPLHYTIFFDAEIELLELLLQRSEVNVNARGEGTMAPLHHAALSGKVEIVRLLLQHPQISVDPPDMYKSTPLFSAAEKGRAEVAKLLLDKGADIHATFQPGHSTPLYIACQNGHREVVELLLGYPGIGSELYRNRETPLHAAAFGGSTAVVNLLLDRPEVLATLENNTGKTTTPLHVACKQGNRESVISLLACPQVQVNAEDRKGFTALHLAIQMGFIKVVRLLLERDAIVDLKSIQMAAKLGNEAGLTIATLLAEKNREAFQSQADAEKDPTLREFFGKVRLVVDPMGQFTVAMKHLKEDGRNSVLFAEHTSTKSPVVIKYYREGIERQHNIELLTGLKKQGIELKHVIDLFSCDGIKYFAWEDPNQTCQLALVFGSEEGAGTEQRSLRSLMDGGVLKHQNNEKRLVFELIVSAVKELHDADIAHGDLKPENLIIFFNKGCLECKVIDLDNARAKNTEWRRGGTLIYYSPELVEEHYKNGGGVQATVESDRWAIGAMLYELITGQKLVCTLMEKGEGDNYEATDADVALEKLRTVDQTQIDVLCKMIRDGGNDYYRNAGELIQNVLRRDKLSRSKLEQMLESSFVKGGATITEKNQMAFLCRMSGKLEEVKQEIKGLRDRLSIQLDDVKEQLKGLPVLPPELANTLHSSIAGLCNLVKNVGLTPHPRCFIVLPTNLEGQGLQTMSTQESQEKLQDLQKFLSAVATSLNDGKPDKLLACMAKNFGNQFHKRVYVALVCEQCWRPQLPVYPVKVKREETQTLLLALTISINLCNVVNLAAGIVSSFYPAVPQALVPQQLVDYLHEIRQVNNDGSDVARFEPVQKAVETGHYGEVKKLGDAAARSLNQFLKLVDPGNDWAGLEPTVQYGVGELKWICKTCFQGSTESHRTLHEQL